jgi:hypothetical protein
MTRLKSENRHKLKEASTMVNRKPLAVAIAALMSAGQAGAINIETTPIANADADGGGAALQAGTDLAAENFSSEFFALDKEVELPPIIIDLDAGLSVGDLIKVTFSTPIFAGTVTTAFNYAGSLPDLHAESNSDIAGQDGAVAFRTAAADGSSVTYRVAAVPNNGGGADEVGGLLELPPGLFSQAGTNVTVSAEVIDGLTGDVIESTTTADTALRNTGSQFRFIVSNLSETIDVDSSRTRFSVGGNTSATHTIGFTIVDDAATLPGATTGTITHSATLGTGAITLTGDFSWLDSSTAATGIQVTNTDYDQADDTGVGALTLNTSGALVAALGAGLTGTDGQITLGNASTVAIPEQTLTLTSSLVYSVAGAPGVGTGASTGAIAGTETGAYDLNGSSVTIYSIPTNANNFIWLTNTGSTDNAAISATIEDNGESFDLGELSVTADSNDQVDVWPAVLAAADAAGVTLSNPARVNVTLVTEAPAADIAVSGVYKVGEDRVNLLSSLDTNQD